MYSADKIKLIPVIEFEPFDYATKEREFPNCGGDEAPELWEEYWRDCLSDSGVVDLRPVLPASWLVDIAQITNFEVLQTLFRISCENRDELEQLDFSALNGGYALEFGGEYLLPGCCGDLATIEDWYEASKHSKEEWSMLWNGHPWTHVSAKDDTLFLADPSEEDPLVQEEPLVSMSRKSLESAIQRAVQDLKEFREVFSPVVKESLGEIPELDMIIDTFIGLNSVAVGRT